MTRARLKVAYRALAEKALEARRRDPERKGWLPEEEALFREAERLEAGGVSPKGWADDIGELLTDLENGIDGFVGK